LRSEGPPTPGTPAALAASRQRQEAEPPDARQLQETVAQLEHALTVRVRVEQAIGVLAERHRLRPRQAFELLRSAARSRGRRVLEVAGEVVDSASNPLLRLPEELAKPPVVRRSRRMPRRPPQPTDAPAPARGRVTRARADNRALSRGPPGQRAPAISRPTPAPAGPSPAPPARSGAPAPRARWAPGPRPT